MRKAEKDTALITSNFLVLISLKLTDSFYLLCAPSSYVLLTLFSCLLEVPNHVQGAPDTCCAEDIWPWMFIRYLKCRSTEILGWWKEKNVEMMTSIVGWIALWWGKAPWAWQFSIPMYTMLSSGTEGSLTYYSFGAFIAIALIQLPKLQMGLVSHLTYCRCLPRD